VRFENKNIFFLVLCKNDAAYCNAGVVVVNSEVLGVAQIFISTIERRI
jgi:hypothetical protein